MSQVKLHGNTVNTVGNLPETGQEIPNFAAVNTSLEEKQLQDYKGKRLVFNIFPSIDTDICANTVRKFNEKASNLENTSVLCISNDLPFALKRFCAAEGLENVVPLSTFRSNFGNDFGVTLTDSPLKGLLARAIIVTDKDGKIVHKQLVDEITDEPNYDEALNALS